MDKTPCLLEARDVSKHVQAPDGSMLEILASVDLCVPRAASTAITGASGSGKTTLLGLLAGLDVPSSGHIVVDGLDLTTLDEEARARMRRRLVGFVFQSFQLLPTLSALENVLLPLELEGARDATARARQALEAVGLARRLRHYPTQLSGGEQQRVAIARAFVHRPALLFADEPTGNLDRRTATGIVDLLFELNHTHGTTLVLVTHDASLAARCDAVLELVDGRVQRGAPA